MSIATAQCQINKNVYKLEKHFNNSLYAYIKDLCNV